MVHRHGDRAPIPLTIQYIGNSQEVLELTNKYGYGQLTDAGRLCGYKLGKYIRRRYGSLLSTRYNKTEIYIRSTDSTRTKMTVLAAMAAVYPAGEDNWSNDVNWTPVPYTTLPVKYDDLLAVFNCPVFINEYKRRQENPLPGLAKYKNLMTELSDVLGVNITKKSSTFYFMYDAFTSQKGLGIPLIPRIEELLPNIAIAAGESLEYIFGNKNYLSLQAGVLLKEFDREVDKLLKGKDIPRIRVYSAHDITVFQFASILGISPPIGVPKYGALLSLELRRDVETGQYIVVPVYLKDPDAEEIYLHIAGCDEFCDLDSFRNLTSKYMLEEKEWRQLCEYHEDFEIDSSPID
ncbi:unnamed protein product [Arctia plantaginis]|uniref:Acid phosphatase n=1 Tax=Arctia plantaginis TaxID=874455 RepID=A0A8S1BG63_ARCPL|nr:unnamed protein product [Arctia plantaginis]